MRRYIWINYISCSLRCSYPFVLRSSYQSKTCLISLDNCAGVKSTLRSFGSVGNLGNFNVFARFHQPTSVMASNGNQSTINFQEFDAFGFDLDHTIAKYKLVALFNHAYKCVTDFLVNEKGYDSCIKDDLHHYKDFICKGLFLDVCKGNILKLNHDGTILRATHGTKLLSEKQVQAEYGADKKWEQADTVKKTLKNSSADFRFFENYFDCPGLVAMARIIDIIDKKEVSGEEKAALYSQAWNDALLSLHHLYDPSHFAVQKGGFFSTVQKDAGRFVEECSADIRRWLKSLRQPGKVVFLLTSSQIDYASCLLDVCLGEDWQSYFDISLFRGRKPAFFTDNNPFYALEGHKEGGEVKELEQHGCYSQGNIDVFNQFLAKHLGKNKEDLKVAYFGDNICADCFPSKHFAGWATVLILEEMDAEGYVCSDDSLPDHQQQQPPPGSKRRKVLEHSSLVTAEEMDYLLTDLWGPFLVHQSEAGAGRGQCTFWGEVIVRYADIAVPSLEYLAGVPLDHSFQCFTSEDTSITGFHPGPPSSLLP